MPAASEMAQVRLAFGQSVFRAVGIRANPENDVLRYWR